MKHGRCWWFGVAALAALAGLSSFWLPSPLPADAPNREFAALRAFEHVQAIAHGPHPSGSLENQKVREYLLAQMQTLALNPREQRGEYKGATAINLYGELPGSDAAVPSILLVAHYDSVSTGPGAADDSTGVATCLETIHALKARGPLRNTIGILFTDAEENHGVCLGAFVFVRDQTNLLENIRVVVNMEARGNRGPALMFQTGRNNRELMRVFRRACPLPVTASFSEEVYRRMPNDTDLTEFLNAGKRGFNFAFVGGIEFYHSPNDTPENLSLRTLQHYGECVVPLVAELGNANLGAFDALQKTGDATFFTVFRGCMALYSASAAKLITYTTAALFFVTLFAGFRNRAISSAGFAKSLGGVIASVILAASLGTGIIYAIVQHSHPRVRLPFIVGAPFSLLALLVILFLAVFATLCLRRFLARASYSELLASGLAVWTALMLGANAMLPGASYLFMWPAFFGTLALLQSYSRAEISFSQIFFTAAPAPLLIAPTIGLLHQTITIGIAPLSAALISLIVCLLPKAGRP
jgi:hypothetical protein